MVFSVISRHDELMSYPLHPQQQPAAATAVGGGVVNVDDDAATAAHITVVMLGESDGVCPPS